MASLIQRLTQRKIAQWAIAYVAGAWLLVEVLSFIAENFGWPAGIVRGAAVFLGVGFFVVLVLAWYHGEKGQQSTTRLELSILAGLLLVAITAASYVGLGSAPQESETRAASTRTVEHRSIAVLPFVNMSPNPDNQYFSDGITDQIITHLSKLENLKVISRTSAMQFRETTKSMQEIGGELGVAHVLEGSVQRDEAKQRVRIVAQLVRIDSDDQLWGETYDRDLSDIFAIQSEVAEHVATALGERLSAVDRVRLEARPTSNLEAHNLYLRGRFFWNKRTESGLLTARDFFQRALEEDPTYAMAYAGLADVYVLLPGYTSSPPTEAYQRAREAAQRALALDSTLAAAHLALAWVHALVRDWTRAEEGLLRAIELNPGYATAHQWYALYLSAIGRQAEARTSMLRAQELDPLSLIITTEVGLPHYFDHDFEAAVEAYQRALHMDADFLPAWEWSLAAYEQAGKFDQAIAAAQQVVRSRGGSAEEASQVAEELAAALDRDGETGYWQTRAEWTVGEESLRTYLTADTYLAGLYAAAGELEAAFRTLNRTIEMRTQIVWIDVEPGLDPLRADPRFAKALARIQPFEP